MKAKRRIMRLIAAACAAAVIGMQGAAGAAAQAVRASAAVRARSGRGMVAAVPSSVMVSISSSSVVLPCYLTTNPAGAQFFLPRHKLGKALKREGAVYAA